MISSLTLYLSLFFRNLVLDLIPGVGAALGILLSALILLPQGWPISLKLIISSVLLQQVQENFVRPRIMQRSVNINPIVMFFALLVGAKVAGLMGVFLAIPLAGIIVGLFDLDELKGKPSSAIASSHH